MLWMIAKRIRRTRRFSTGRLARVSFRCYRRCVIATCAQLNRAPHLGRVFCSLIVLCVTLAGGAPAAADAVDDPTQTVLSDRSLQTSLPQRVPPPPAQSKSAKNSFGLPWWPFSQRSQPAPPPTRDAPARASVSSERSPPAQARSELRRQPTSTQRALPAPSMQPMPESNNSDRRAVARVVFLVLIAGLAAFVLIWFFKQMRLLWRTRDPRVKRDKRKLPAKPISPIPKHSPLQRAEEFARQKRYLEAAQSLAYGALERASSAPFGFSVTPRELVAGLAVSAQTRGALKNLITVVERGNFGARDISRDDYMRCLSDFHRVSQSESDANMRS